MMCLVTVLQRDLGVYSDDKLNDDPNFSNSEDLFIHGILRGKGGTCSSLPTLYSAVGRRLGYPLKLVKTGHHCFARWDHPSGERFNIECTVLGLDTPTDESYQVGPTFAPPDVIQAGGFYKSKTPRQELGGFLIQRAYCLLHNDRHREAVEACVGACVAAPQDKLHENTFGLMMGQWKFKLWGLTPPLFPEVVVHPVSGRRFPATIRLEVEREVIRLEILQDLLEDPDKEPWRRALRKQPPTWPHHVPIRIDASRQQRSLFGPERAES